MKHFSHETPSRNVAVFAIHTTTGSVRDHQNYLTHDGQEWRYSLTGDVMTGQVLCWYDTEAEANTEQSS